MTTTREKLAAAFKQIRKEGGIARMNFMCCSSCAWYELAEKYGEDETRTMVFWNQQSDDSFVGGSLQYALCLQWQGDKDLIAKALADHDLVAITPADSSTTFIVYESWKHAALELAEDMGRKTKWADSIYDELLETKQKLEKAERKLKRAGVS